MCDCRLRLRLRLRQWAPRPTGPTNRARGGLHCSLPVADAAAVDLIRHLKQQKKQKFPLSWLATAALESVAHFPRFPPPCSHVFIVGSHSPSRPLQHSALLRVIASGGASLSPGNNKSLRVSRLLGGDCHSAATWTRLPGNRARRVGRPVHWVQIGLGTAAAPASSCWIRSERGAGLSARRHAAAAAR